MPGPIDVTRRPFDPIAAALALAIREAVARREARSADSPPTAAPIPVGVDSDSGDTLLTAPGSAEGLSVTLRVIDTLEAKP
ncbi:MAG TPA: hypothetical protein VGQ64_07940 [Candidatus Limnocylindrales bacterium]|jgi:hypothetical protein|nr:hypothetical protein [Candidatus Limnocylindrales bacterium]